jgi:hypothetical protein
MLNKLLFLSDHQHHVHLQPLIEEANVMKVQDGIIKSSINDDSKSMAHKSQAIKEMTIKILSTLKTKETG